MKMFLKQGSTSLPNYSSFTASSSSFFFTGISEIGCCLCFSPLSCLWIFLDAFPSRCPVPPHPGSVPRQTLNASQRHFQRASTIMLQLSRWTRWLLCSFSPSLWSLRDSVHLKIENYTLFFVLISFIYPVLGRCSPLTNPPFLSFTFFFLSIVRGKAGHNEDYRKANIGHIS